MIIELCLMFGIGLIVGFVLACLITQESAANDE